MMIKEFALYYENKYERLVELFKMNGLVQYPTKVFGNLVMMRRVHIDYVVIFVETVDFVAFSVVAFSGSPR